MKTTAFFTRIIGWLTGSRLTVDNSVVKDLDLNRFIGSWYEVARFDHFFERGMSHTKANYVIREDDSIDAIDPGIKDGGPKTAKGKAKRTEIPSLFRVDLFTLTIASCCLMPTTGMCSLVAVQTTTFGFSPARPSSPKRPKR